MSKRPIFIYALLWFCHSTAFGAGLCPDPSPQRENAFEFGVQALSLLPNRLPQFTASVPVFGALVGVPLFGQLVQLQANYGSLNGLILHTFETGFRYQFRLPFATPFLQAGAHYLRYRFQGENYTYFGFNGSGGFTLAMNQNFDINLLIKVYAQEKWLFSYGGSLVLLL